MQDGQEQLTPRQRAFQTSLFLLLTMMLLEPPRDPGRLRGATVDLPALDAEHAVRGGVLDASLRRNASVEVRNVSGLYRGAFVAERDDGNGSRTRDGGGTAVVSLDMLAVEGVEELFVVRGLFSLAGTTPPRSGGARDRKKHLLTSAYGVFAPSLGRLAMLANVGAPRSDLVLRYNASVVNATARAPSNSGDSASRRATPQVPSAPIIGRRMTDV